MFGTRGDGTSRRTEPERQREPGPGGGWSSESGAELVSAARGQPFGARPLVAALPRAAPALLGGAER